MRQISKLVLTALVLALTIGCSSKQPKQTYRIPPRIDLTRHEMIGVIEFRSSAEGELGPMATRRFG